MAELLAECVSPRETVPLSQEDFRWESPSVLGPAGFSAWAWWQYQTGRSPRLVEAARRRRLRSLLRFVVRRSPFYRERFREHDVETCRLASLPPTSKADVMANFDHVATDPAITRAGVEQFMGENPHGGLFLRRYVLSHTSGSQGQPLLIVQDRRSLEVLCALQWTRGNAAFTRDWAREFLRRMREPGRIALFVTGDPYNSFASVWEHVPAEAAAYVKLLKIRSGDPDAVAKLNDFRPHNLISSVSLLRLLAVRGEGLRLPELRQVVTIGEVLTPGARAQLGEAFGVPVLDVYSSGECTFLSSGCPHGAAGSHINADWAIVEITDDNYRPVAPGETGTKVLVTNLANRAQPLIRYELGDRVRLGAPGRCACGSWLPRIETVEGRSADYFWVPGGGAYRPLSGLAFKHAFDGTGEVREWQVVQHTRDELLVRVELMPGARLDEAKLRRLLDERVGLSGASVRLGVEVASLPPDPATGKIRRIVSHVGPPSDLDPALRG